MKIKIFNQELIKELVGKEKKFPKYTTQLMNLANQNAQGTRPKVVGQLSELIKECPYNSYEEWAAWYLSRNPEAIDKATKKILLMINLLKEAINQIDENLIREWVTDLVLVKTFIGLKFQKAILKKIAEKKGTSYRLATPEEEAKGIDGFVNNTPISIKPTTYKFKDALPEKIAAKIVYYQKIKGGIEIDLGDF
ncbi:MAG: MjaI family restriction endonuclease [Candidatus Heimdallarchaeota archaeon]